ncbi:hypothetical protein CROQUDRAFT_88978 [Cronartium quercuum f. sp. fusiforme G11]|uniref:Uncharacterized protein n=1 Tax=Cronartium quercuum f. sp. fusiforme G11 TaxID=708437 RepID=A0A9P6TFE0_9BASI|nr:hypothetical protein CROQUDRAFT_88978 [Cronartium quercuum f. sp. fusiforme G11]
MGTLEAIFKKIATMLRGFPNGGYKTLTMAVDAATLTTKPAGNFCCDKMAFCTVVNLVEHGLKLASQPINPLSNPQDPIMVTVLAGVQTLETRVDMLLLDAANRASANPESEQPRPKAKTFAQAAKAGVRQNNQQPKPTPKTPKLPLPTKFPHLSHLQCTRVCGSFVEMDMEANALKGGLDKSLMEGIFAQFPTGPPPIHIRALARNRFTGEIQIHFQNQGALDTIASLPTQEWIRKVNPALKLKTEIYPIIVHGVPTSFDPLDHSHLSSIMNENPRLLNSLQRALWAS